MMFGLFGGSKPEVTEVKTNPVGAAVFVPNQDASLFYRSGNKRDRAEEGYRRNVIIYRSIREIVNAISSIQIQVKQNGEVLEDHESLALINHPNPHVGCGQFIENIFVDYMLYGEMFVSGVSRNSDVRRNAVPLELWRLDPLYMKVKPSKTGIPQAYIYDQNGVTKKFDVNPITGESSVFFYKAFNPLDYWRGLAPLEAAALSGDIHNNGLEWNYSLLRNGARPSGAWMIEGEASEDTIARMRQFEKERYTGSENAGRTLVLTGAIKWEEMGKSPKDMDFLSTMKETQKYIASAFGVPLPLVDNDASTFNNLEQAKERLWTDTVIPLFRKFLGSFGNWLLPRYGDNLEFDCNLDSIPALEGVRNRRRQGMVDLVDAGIISVNEARKKMGYEPIDSPLADDLLVQSTRIPLTMAGSTDEQEEKRMVDAIQAMGLEIKAPLSEGERVPPQSAQNNAERGLEYRREYGRGGTDVGVARARNISNGDKLGDDTIKAMAQFNRHRDNYNPDKKESDGGPTAGTIAWLLWGGTTGVDWAIGKSKKLQS